MDIPGPATKLPRFDAPDLVMLTVELKFHRFRKPETVDANKLKEELTMLYQGQIMKEGQEVLFEYKGTNYKFTVTKALGEDQVKGAIKGKQADQSNHGLKWTKNTTLFFEASDNSGITIANQEIGGSKNLFKKDHNLQELVGGLDNEFQDIFRRAFQSRVFPQTVIEELGIQHVKGILLWGPPGTGKTLIAREICKALTGRQPKIVNGPEILSKFVGDTEKKVRELFADAEKDKEKGDESELHVIIFDEIDAICKARGSTRDGAGVHDSIVNQLLTKIDGVESLNNILLIGMTNRKDLLDEALLRPGRLEVHIEIGLPDENGRIQILDIKTKKMKESKKLSDDVDLKELAKETENFSGAELEGLVRSAVSFALEKKVDKEDKPQTGNVQAYMGYKAKTDDIQVNKGHFSKALEEVKAAFGADVTTLESYRVNSILGFIHTDILKEAKEYVQKASDRTPLFSCLLEGPCGSGKTALAATIALESRIPFIKTISVQSMVGLSEGTKCGMLNKVFEDAYKSPRSVIILDDIEGILEYVKLGPRFSNLILQTLLALIKRRPPQERKLVIIGTTSMKNVMEEMGILSALDVSMRVPLLEREDVKRVLLAQEIFAPNDVNKAMEVLAKRMPIKKLLMLIEMCKQSGSGFATIDLNNEEIYSVWRNLAKMIYRDS